MSLPCWPSTKSFSSPPSRVSTPLLPRIVSLPAPPSTVIPIRAARSPVAEKLSLPPLAFTTSFSDVPMSIENGAGSRRSKRTRAPLAVAVKTSAAAASVDLDRVGRVAALVQVGVVAGVPDHPVVAALAEDLIVGVAAGEDVVLLAAGEDVEAAAAEERVVASLPEELVGARATRERVVVGATGEIGPRQRAVGLVQADRVVAGLAEDLDQRGVGDRRRAAGHGDGAAVHEDLAGSVAADRDRVAGAVAEDGQDAAAERRGRRCAGRPARRE